MRCCSGGDVPGGKRPRRRREPLQSPRPLPLPIPFPAYGQPGTFHFRAADGIPTGFEHDHSVTYRDSWAAEVADQQDGFRGAVMINLRSY